MSKSFFSTAMERIVSAREKQARRYVNSVLLSFDDETLKSLGHDRDQLKKAGSSSLPF